MQMHCSAMLLFVWELKQTSHAAAAESKGPSSTFKNWPAVMLRFPMFATRCAGLAAGGGPAGFRSRVDAAEVNSAATAAERRNIVCWNFAASFGRRVGR